MPREATCPEPGISVSRNRRDRARGLSRDSVVNVTALVTVDKRNLRDRAGRVPPHLMPAVDDRLRRVLGV